MTRRVGVDELTGSEAIIFDSAKVASDRAGETAISRESKGLWINEASLSAFEAGGDGILIGDLSREAESCIPMYRLVESSTLSP